MQTQSGVQALVRRTHEERVLLVLREQGALSRNQIARAVGLSRTTLSEITGSLLHRGAIVVIDTDAADREGSGRPAERLALDPASGQFMGVDFGHGRVHVVVADASHEIVASGSDRYEDRVDWPTRLEVAFGLLERLSAEFGVHYGALQGVGIGVPGPYSGKPGVRGFPSHRAAADGFHEASVDEAFGERFGAPVVVDNNTRLAALAEATFGSEAIENLLYVRLSDGVGGGLVVGGRLVSGSAGLAGELGHVTVRPDGNPCRCGKHGCLETIASTPAILAACRTAGLAVETLDDLATAVARSHPVADQVLREASAALSQVLAAVGMALNPAEIVIGGEITRIAPVIVEQAAATVRFELFPGAASPGVRSAYLSDDDGALGALAAVFHSSPLLAGYPETPARLRPATTQGVADGRAH
ncbi:ROK family transcriptional regulator [Kribbella sp.]|uniref:ROK family transcriptional regulator n=1 Tax=Kribbella sp. TaxID=1871183 RepID=UPI002D601AC3|nr:ROK family transcriptional regulator [Kribbella sp.]HZX08962.1 ROK family transcriptional regulator [Kribbella sp.]